MGKISTFWLMISPGTQPDTKTKEEPFFEKNGVLQQSAGA